MVYLQSSLPHQLKGITKVNPQKINTMKFFSFFVLFALVLVIVHGATAPVTEEMDAVAEVKDEIAQDVDAAEGLDTTAKVAEEEDVEPVDDSVKELDEVDDENMEENSVKSYYGKCKKKVCINKKYCYKEKCGYYYKTYLCPYYRYSVRSKGYGYGHHKKPKYCKTKLYKYCDKCYYKPYCYYKTYSCYAKYPAHKKW